MSENSGVRPSTFVLPSIGVLMFWIGGAIALGVLATVQVMLRPGMHPDPGLLFLVHVPHWISWAGFALIVWLVLQRLDRWWIGAGMALAILCPMIIAAHAAFVAWWDLIILVMVLIPSLAIMIINSRKSFSDIFGAAHSSRSWGTRSWRL